jgi:Raf kinase inhibitor-like YbhB/YbcL family protein
VLDLRHAHPSANGENLSPNLQWFGAPANTQSFAVTCFDPDAPTGSGWWHWIVIDIPANITELPKGMTPAQQPDSAVELRNDFGELGFGGSAPPPGDRPHRYIFAVYALDVPTLGLEESTTAAVAGFNLTAHSLARGHITGLYSH